MKHLNLLALVIGIFFVAVCAFVRLADPLPARIARELLFDQYQRLKPRAYDPQPVRIVDMMKRRLPPSGNGRGRARTRPPCRSAARIGCCLDRLRYGVSETDRMSPASIGRRPDVRAAMGADVAGALDGKLPEMTGSLLHPWLTAISSSALASCRARTRFVRPAKPGWRSRAWIPRVPLPASPRRSATSRRFAK